MMLLSNVCHFPVILCNATRLNVILLNVILMNVMAPFLRVCSMSCFEFWLFHSKNPFLKQKWRCTIILSTCHLVNLSFCQWVILSMCHFVNSSFCLLIILSAHHFVNSSFCQLIILSTHHFAYSLFWPHKNLQLVILLILSFCKIVIVILSTHKFPTGHFVNWMFC